MLQEGILRISAGAPTVYFASDWLVAAGVCFVGCQQCVFFGAAQQWCLNLFSRCSTWMMSEAILHTAGAQHTYALIASRSKLKSLKTEPSKWTPSRGLHSGFMCVLLYTESCLLVFDSWLLLARLVCVSLPRSAKLSHLMVVCSRFTLMILVCTALLFSSAAVALFV